MFRLKTAHLAVATMLIGFLSAGCAAQLPATEPLRMEGDIASTMVAGIDEFLLKEIDKSVASRAQYWKRDVSSTENYNNSVESNRRQLAHMLGVRDQRIAFDGLELLGTTEQAALVGRGRNYEVYSVRWPAFGDVYGEGLLLTPTKGSPRVNIIAIPDADQMPEQIAGLVEGVFPSSQYARRLAASGCRVVIPMMISREIKKTSWAKPLPVVVEGKLAYHIELTQREFLNRSAFVLGRTLMGYEVQKVLALVDWFAREAAGSQVQTAVMGWGEGGLIALYAAALDTRIKTACVSGYLDCRQNLWQEPIDRNVFGLLEQFGDAEVASLIAPRTLIVEAARGPELTLPNKGGAPGRLVTPKLENVQGEIERARQLTAGLKPTSWLQLVVSDDGTGPYGTEEALGALLAASSPEMTVAPAGEAPQHLRKTFDARERHRRQVHEIDRHNQWLLHKSPDVRKEFFKHLHQDDLPYHVTVRWYREYFYNEVIGRYPYELLPPNVRSRKVYDEEKWTGYEVVMDVYEGVIAYGILLLPKDIEEGEKRPVVVCQHGLEGRAQDVIEGGSSFYHDFAAQLADRGFIVFAPQNPYLFRERFRTIQRKSYLLKKTLFSIIVPQHQQILNWLASLPNVDPERIAFYGLSYGGASAMRIPALVTDYCLSICSANFTDWAWKTASTDSRYSYVWTGEYEMFEFDLGSTFNYAEMAALIAPRPFMVERGHLDNVSSDERVAYEFAKIRHLYAVKLNIPDRCEIEWFVGPHTINGKGTFDFLHKHLDWPKP